MTVLKQLANVTGVRLPSTIVPEGESLIPYGEERKRALQEEIYALPTLTDAYTALREIRAEQQPVDVRIPLQRVRMSPLNAGLYGEGSEHKPALAYTSTAFDHVASVIKPQSVTAGFTKTMLALPPSIRSDAFNYFASSAMSRGDSKDVILRTNLSPVRQSGKVELRRSINAVVSDRYTAVDDHDLIANVNSILPDGARCRYTQSEDRSDLEILWPMMTREIKVGDVVLASLMITNSQVKKSSIVFVPKLLRTLCLNFTTAWTDGVEFDASVRHVGEVRSKMAEAMRQALAVIDPFVKAFGDAYQNSLPEFAPTRGEAIKRFIEANALPEAVGLKMSELWNADGTMSAGDTLAGLANAATRVSQSYAFAQSEPIERAAGRVIRQGWDSIA